MQVEQCVDLARAVLKEGLNQPLDLLACDRVPEFGAGLGLGFLSPLEEVPNVLEVHGGFGTTSGSDSEEHENEAHSLKHPSVYLQKRCPLCFGGINWHDCNSVADVIVCLDACFTQKRRQGGKDPVHKHPQTVFVPQADVKSMEEFVDETRNSQSHRRGFSGKAGDDGFEGPMKVPASVLNECGDSFKAADEKREKASTKFFADTGLMALLCRHDRVLWLVNMTSAGEKQYYALALLQRLFEHLPPTMTVGLLYDIGCQLHRSCVKWNFLSEFIDRITFGISVFHAYGHQWPCQVVYHPRKCVGFGLADGEGCERFWSALKLLIPTMRVSGYHRRIYTIDTQVRHLDSESLYSLGAWLARKWAKCQTRKNDALSELLVLNINEELLRKEWKDQIKQQTKPAIRRSKDKGRKAVEEVLGLQAMWVSSKKRVEDLERRFLADLGTGVELDDLQDEIDSARASADTVYNAFKRKRETLGVDGRLSLKKLMDDKFIHLRANAFALKTRIRDKLRERKFELERLERAYRHNSGEQKLHAHTDSQVKRKEPGIVQLAKKYNELCMEIEKLIQERKAPRGAISPLKIVRENLFLLDVDDDIWQDIGLNDEDDGGSPPLWLADEKVREGIKSLLLLDRCMEEEIRLKRERDAMQDWFMQEWKSVENAIAAAHVNGDIDMEYQLKLHRQYLCRICTTWQRVVSCVPCSSRMPDSWGPSDEEIQETLAFEFHGSWHEGNQDEVDGIESDDNEDNDGHDCQTEVFTEEQEIGVNLGAEDDEVLQEIEIAEERINAMSEEKAHLGYVWQTNVTDFGLISEPPSESSSPRKRHHQEIEEEW